MARIKILGGTPSGDFLCKTCRNCSYTRTDRGAESYQCHIFNKPIKGKVVECSRYDHKCGPSLGDMYDIAWTVKTDKKGNAIGFERADGVDIPFRVGAGF